ncbi:UDP-4-amino-4,6-dideoxy-N-acetyl-beta-L-altrosamine transaminase [Bacteriovorax stolpii]|uniref:UDP-4-amino-4, 6-dideoxy-N-acetyl-beta-L-altrosamine transaminase n=1 Tax=Bacteriovorax stolpii TaxID=960 RepID=UPI001FD1CDF0|nr:UDP-4-amino-4,6-dideoxy-N-acetyl-beta-L-altrosamine transaminase [Bacteriovorax stolpii]
MKVPYGKQTITQEDINAVVEVLKSDFLTQGPSVFKFEEEFAKAVGAKYAVAFCNATAALHTGFKALNKNTAKKVLVSSITFAASSNCVLYEGGEVEFVDIDPTSFNLDLNIIEEKLKADPNAYQGIIPVDFAGLPVDTEKLKEIADRYNLWIMEDACHAVGGGFFNSKNEFIQCGSGKYSDLTVFSFHPVKHIATGEGGMITTNSEEKYRHLLKLRSHGIERDEKLFKVASHGGWYHEMQELGFNYRMSDINAALGLSQLRHLKNNIEKRNAVAKTYKDFFSATGFSYQQYNDKKTVNAYHLFVIQTNKRRELYDFLKKKEIYTQVHYIPVHKHPYYQENGFKEVKLPHAENFYAKALSLPMYHGISEEELTYVLKMIESF